MTGSSWARGLNPSLARTVGPQFRFFDYLLLQEIEQQLRSMQGSSLGYDISEGQHYEGRSGDRSQRNGVPSQRGGPHPRGRGSRGGGRGSDRRGSGRGYDRYEREDSETSDRGGRDRDRDRGGRGDRRGSLSFRGRGSGGGGGRYEERGGPHPRRGDRKSYGPGRRDDDLDQPPQLQADDHRLNGLRNGGVGSSGSSSSAGGLEESHAAGKGSDRTGPSKRAPKSVEAVKGPKAPSPTNAAVNGSGDKAPATASAPAATATPTDSSSRPSVKAAAAPTAKKEKVQGR